MFMHLKKEFFIIIGLIFLLSASIHADERTKKLLNKKKNYKVGEILIKYKDSAIEGDPRVRYSRTNRLSKIRSFKKTKVDHLKLPADMTVEEAMEQFKSDSNVEFVEPNYVYSINKTPNDEYFNKLWGLHNAGQLIDGISGTADADIDAPEAWDSRSDAPDIVVAVVDSGIDYDHPDLSANIWINTGEIPGNGIDDDGNGNIDDVRGWDFVDNDNDPMDQNGHGTHVSGIIGAVGDNTIGVTGVAWNVKIMTARGLGDDGYGYTSDLINAIEYATANGADVVNLSWTGEENSIALKDTINNSTALFVCAAGNDSTNNDSTPLYPASYDCANIISVAATDQDDNLADFSNYGQTSVDVGAPGVDIFSTTYDSAEYGYMSGTSMAAPYVSGVAAMVKASRPECGNLEIKATIENNVNFISSLNEKTTTNGRINLNNITAAISNYQHFGPEFPIAIPTEDYRSEPDVAFLKNGYSMVIWKTEDSYYDHSVFGQVFDPYGNKVGSNITVGQVTCPLSEYK